MTSRNRSWSPARCATPRLPAPTARRTCSRRSKSPPARTCAASAVWSCSPTRSTPPPRPQDALHQPGHLRLSQRRPARLPRRGQSDRHRPAPRRHVIPMPPAAARTATGRAVHRNPGRRRRPPPRLPRHASTGWSSRAPASATCPTRGSDVLTELAARMPVVLASRTGAGPVLSLHLRIPRLRARPDLPRTRSPPGCSTRTRRASCSTWRCSASAPMPPTVAVAVAQPAA